MHYQLVLQFRGDSLDDYDLIVCLENELIEALGDAADVDGHDIGSGESNIFILTAEPESTFQLAKPVLERLQLLGAVTVAHRLVAGKHYTVIWPPHSQQEFAVA